MKGTHAEVFLEILEHGTHQTMIDGWYVYLSLKPEAGGDCPMHPGQTDQTRAPFGHWLSRLAEEKYIALVEVEPGHE